MVTELDVSGTQESEIKRLEKIIEQQREALEFYADRTNFECMNCYRGKIGEKSLPCFGNTIGYRAKEALAASKEC